MRVLVTGGCGFIGSNLVRHLVLDKCYYELNVDKLTYAGNVESVSSLSNQGNHRILAADICDKAAMTDAFASFRPQRVMHLAAESHADRSITDAGDFIDTNVVGTFTLLDVGRRNRDGLPDEVRDGFTPNYSAG